ncbi:MAG: photosynthetic reaction center subunit H [Ideonella sp.]|jgi:photosynthetic reaction center H subunit|nr:photosynthetic reaction center subunit H [Ideonella sp.]
MGTGAITSYVDVAQLVLYAFWAFFFGLIYYLVRENHREGYPMVTDDRARGEITGWPVPAPKVYKLRDGREVMAPRPEPLQVPNGTPTHGYIGAPLVPNGNPLTAGMGAGAYANRSDTPDAMRDGSPKIVPLRLVEDYDVSPNDTDPRGLPAIGADGEVGGTIVDVWTDQMESLIRYLEVEVATESGPRRVLLPMPFVRVKRDGVYVSAILGSQFAGVPATRHPEQITLLEEEKISAYYGAGTLYATPQRAEPLV